MFWSAHFRLFDIIFNLFLGSQSVTSTDINVRWIMYGYDIPSEGTRAKRRKVFFFRHGVVPGIWMSNQRIYVGLIALLLTMQMHRC